MINLITLALAKLRGGNGGSNGGGNGGGVIYEHNLMIYFSDKGTGNIQSGEPKYIWVACSAFSQSPAPINDWNILLTLFKNDETSAGVPIYGSIACNGLLTFEYGDSYANSRPVFITFDNNIFSVKITHTWTYTDDGKTPGDKISINDTSLIMQSDHGNYSFQDYDFSITDSVRKINILAA